MTGRHVTLVPLDAERHADALFAAANGGEKDRLWTYLFDGLYVEPAAFKAVLAERAKSEDPALPATVENRTKTGTFSPTLLKTRAFVNFASESVSSKKP